MPWLSCCVSVSGSAATSGGGVMWCDVPAVPPSPPRWPPSQRRSRPEQRHKSQVPHSMRQPGAVTTTTSTTTRMLCAEGFRLGDCGGRDREDRPKRRLESGGSFVVLLRAIQATQRRSTARRLPEGADGQAPRSSRCAGTPGTPLGPSRSRARWLCRHRSRRPRFQQWTLL